MLANRFRIRLAKRVCASHEVMAISSDAAVVQQVETEKLKSPEYEKSLELEWAFEAHPAEIIGVDKEPLD
jgi:hypothetical protein